MIWCILCQCAVAWSLMADAESPATLFELLYIFFPEVALRIAYDNGCNLLTYGLNRDPRWIAAVRIFIDGMHAKGHTACARSFDVGAILATFASKPCCGRARPTLCVTWRVIL